MGSQLEGLREAHMKGNNFLEFGALVLLVQNNARLWDASHAAEGQINGTRIEWMAIKVTVDPTTT